MSARKSGRSLRDSEINRSPRSTMDVIEAYR
jgi:hypothetical protein